MNESQCSTESSIPGQLSFDLIHRAIEDCQRLFVGSLAMRLPTPHPDMPIRERVDLFADAMIQLSNQAAACEEGVAKLSIIMHVLQSDWDVIAAPELAKPRPDKYMDRLGRLSGAIASNRELYNALQRIRATSETGRRTVDRLSSMQAAASRAAGIVLGPTH